MPPGLGLAMASALLQTGASKIYLLARRESVLNDAIKTLATSSAAPSNASEVLAAVPCDVTDQSSVSAAVAQIQRETGHVDVLVNNAGVIGPKNGQAIYKATSIEEMRDALLMGFSQWEPTMAINTQAVIGVSAAFLPLLEAANTRRGWAPGKVTAEGEARKQDGAALAAIGADSRDDRMAQIITVASVASFMRFCTAGLAYNASKSAAAHLSKMMGSFLAPWGIRSNVVAPGPYPSEMNAKGGTFGTGQVPQGRMGDFEDISGLTLFLVGRAGAYVNGTVQVTDGGRMGGFPGTY